jgi:hemoglobin-like flavoprotein
VKKEVIMNAEQIAAVQSTFEKVHPLSDITAEMFYNRLFELDPSVQSLFKGDMKEQGRKLMHMISLAVSRLNRLETLVPAVQALGTRHVDYGVKHEHYDTVGAALLWTLEQSLGGDFTPEVKEAWAEAYHLLTDVMKEAAVAVH